MATVVLKSGHVQPVWAGHPWVYAQAVERLEGGAMHGEEVTVVDPRGNFLGRGFYSSSSAIAVRILTRSKGETLDAQFFRRRIEHAANARRTLGLPSEETDGFRLVHAEGDGLPGLVVDRFGDVVSVQLSTMGMKLREEAIFDALHTVVAPRAIVDRTPAAVAKGERFAQARGVVRGEAVTAFEMRERGLRYRIPLEIGQKTGFYFDQRVLRGRFEQLARGKRVLDAYAYVGPFAIAAARGGASEVVAVDESALAIEIGAECARDNGVAEQIRFMRQDARKALQDAKGSFDLVIVDPPRFAPTRSAKQSALVGYAKLAELGCRATKPGGVLVVCSCSAAVDMAGLTRALALGALRANVQAVVLERYFQGLDHPVPAAFPEGLYLKALVARVEAR
jgi:23S rRNA (cytosine1962-C5)-methyltransferase